MIDLDALKKEARSKQTSSERLRELAALNEALSRLIAKSKKTPPEVLADLSSSADMPTRRAVAANPNTELAVLARLAGDPQWTVLKAVAVNPTSSDAILGALAQHPRVTVRQALIRRHWNQATPLPESVLGRLARDGESEVRSELAILPLPNALLEALHHDEDVWVRRNALGNRQTSAATLRDAATDPDERIRAEVAFSRNTPRDVTEALSRDPAARVRQDSLHPGGYFFSQDTLDRLATDDVAFVREAALESGRVSQAVLTQLSGDASTRVRQLVAREGRDPALLTRLAADSNFEVRYALSLNMHAPPESLHQLSGETGNLRQMMCQAVASHPGARHDTLLRLARDENRFIRYSVAARRVERIERAATLGFGEVYDYAPLDLLQLLTQDPEESVRSAAKWSLCRHENCPLETLQALSRDADDAFARGAITQLCHHPDVTPSLLEPLAAGDSFVAAAVRERLAMFTR